jgi:hypothetical protein
MDLVELAKTACYLRAIGADEQPVHLEEADLGRVHEQLDGVRFSEAASARVLNRVDAE